ncbi:unnamed protein product [Protopolystoma xenopodis]|uniref:Uncharacterized protein n=1 Tax=Protopolystoma xenopodis TaxID=117903 RepID=A0A3S5AYD8_9PLAT|nr:unnamed protein product [Protopolystoma xenopodis]
MSGVGWAAGGVRKRQTRLKPDPGQTSIPGPGCLGAAGGLSLGLVAGRFSPVQLPSSPAGLTNASTPTPMLTGLTPVPPPAGLPLSQQPLQMGLVVTTTSTTMTTTTQFSQSQLPVSWLNGPAVCGPGLSNSIGSSPMLCSVAGSTWTPTLPPGPGPSKNRPSPLITGLGGAGLGCGIAGNVSSRKVGPKRADGHLNRQLGTNRLC